MTIETQRARGLAVLVVLVLVTIANPSPAPAATADFVTAEGTHLQIGGLPWRLHGASTYGTTNPGATTTVDELVSLAVVARVNTLRIVNMFDERGLNPAAPTAEGDWLRVDQLLARMQAVGLRAVLDLSAFRNHLHERELHNQGKAALSAGEPVPTSCSGQIDDALARCVGIDWCLAHAATCTNPYSVAREAEWATFLAWVAARENSVTGVSYADDPTIAIVAFAGEPAPPNSGEPLRPETPEELTAFYARTFDEWKSHDQNHLVTTGGLLHIDWEEVYENPNGSGIDHEAIFGLPNQDVLSIHNYFTAFPPTAAGDYKSPKIAAAAATQGKPWITEEFGFLQAPTDGSATYTEADRAVWFQRVYDIQQNPSSGVPSAGAAFWNLGTEVAGGSHDVNPSTPATWVTVQRNAEDGCLMETHDMDGDGLTDACDPDNRAMIDIVPRSSTNSIRLRSTGTTPVAILSSPTFAAPDRVNVTSLTFGQTGTEASFVSCDRPKDVNGDGRRDLVCQFLTGLTGFRLGDRIGTLRGATTGGARFAGTDQVTVKR